MDPLTILDNLVCTLQKEGLVWGHLVEDHLLDGRLATPAQGEGGGGLCCVRAHPLQESMHAPTCGDP